MFWKNWTLAGDKNGHIHCLPKTFLLSWHLVSFSSSAIYILLSSRKTLNISFPYSWEYCVQMLSIFEKPSSKKGKKHSSSGLIYTWFLVQNGMKKLAFFAKQKSPKAEREKGIHTLKWVSRVTHAMSSRWLSRSNKGIGQAKIERSICENNKRSTPRLEHK